MIFLNYYIKNLDLHVKVNDNTTLYIYIYV